MWTVRPHATRANQATPDAAVRGEAVFCFVFNVTVPKCTCWSKEKNDLVVLFVGVRPDMREILYNPTADAFHKTKVERTSMHVSFFYKHFMVVAYFILISCSIYFF